MLLFWHKVIVHQLECTKQDVSHNYCTAIFPIFQYFKWLINFVFTLKPFASTPLNLCNYTVFCSVSGLASNYFLLWFQFPTRSGILSFPWPPVELQGTNWWWALTHREPAAVKGTLVIVWQLMTILESKLLKRQLGKDRKTSGVRIDAKAKKADEISKHYYSTAWNDWGFLICTVLQIRKSSPRS